MLIGSDAVEAVLRDRRVVAATLTGSTGAGIAIARTAGGEIKKTVLELGGSDPYVVLEDADLDATAETCVAARLINSGQSCIAAKRFIVLESVRRPFEELFVQKMSAARMGDPLQEGTEIGPQARHDLRDASHHHGFLRDDS